MRWARRPPPKRGDERTKRRFAWWPTRFRNVTVWFESYTITWVYDCNWHKHGGPSSGTCEMMPEHCNLEWVRSRVRLKGSLPQASVIKEKTNG